MTRIFLFDKNIAKEAIVGYIILIVISNYLVIYLVIRTLKVFHKIVKLMVVALASYVLKLWGSTSQRTQLLNASARIATARATLRLFDDAATIKNMINYGFGKQEGLLWGTLGVSSGIFTLTYLQAEKVVWLLDTGILNVSKETEFKIRTSHKLLWSLSALVGFIRSTRAVAICYEETKSPTPRKCASARLTQATLASSKVLLDLIHAVSWLPSGWLWGNALTTQQASAVATAAGILGLVVHYQGKKLVSSK